MLIHEIGRDRADAIEFRLTDVRHLDGRFALREWTLGRYHLVPMHGPEANVFMP